MAIRTLGTGKTYATWALAFAACSSGDTVEAYATVADGIPDVYYGQTLAISATTRTLTNIDRVLIYNPAGGNLLTITGASTVTLNNMLMWQDTNNYALSSTHSAGTLTVNGGIYKTALAGNAVRVEPAGNNAICNCYGVVAIGGFRFDLGTRTGCVFVTANCIGIGLGTPNGFISYTASNGSGTSHDVWNCWFYAANATDVVNTNTQCTFHNIYSVDASASTTTCTVANAKFVDMDGFYQPFGLANCAIMVGSSLIGAGADPGVAVVDNFGTSKPTDSGTFDVGACHYSVTTAATAPTGVECVNWTGNTWNVHWTALTNKEHPIIKVTVGGTAYYAYPTARTTPGNQRYQIGWTTDVALARFLNLPTIGLTFDLAGVQSIAVASANVCEVASTYTAATVRTLAATGSAPVFSGIANFAQRSTGLQVDFNSALTGTPTSFDVHIKPSARMLSAELASETYLVARLPYTSLRTYSFMEDISGDFYNAGVKYWAAVRARNALGVDSNVAQLSAYGGGGNVTLQTTVNNYTLKAPLLALNPL